MNNKRIKIVKNALDIYYTEDAIRIVEHLVKHGCEKWIDEYGKHNGDEPLTDVHYECNFEDMIDWQYEYASPSEMLGMSADINDYPEMLDLEEEGQIIFWYGLVD